MDNLKYDCLMMMSFRWCCCQLLSRDFMVLKVKPSVRALDFGFRFG